MTNSRKLAHNHYYHIFPRQSILEFQLHIATHSTLNKIIIIITTFVFSNNNAMCVFLSLSLSPIQSKYFIIFFRECYAILSLSLYPKKKLSNVYMHTQLDYIFLSSLFVCWLLLLLLFCAKTQASDEMKFLAKKEEEDENLQAR